jgi:hypothetical protein
MMVYRISFCQVQTSMRRAPIRFWMYILRLTSNPVLHRPAHLSLSAKESGNQLH